MAVADALPVRRPSRSRNTSPCGAGNFGARPNPPCSGSKPARKAATARSSAPWFHGADGSVSAVIWRTTLATRPADATISSRSVAHISATRAASSVTPMRPPRAVGGRYVPTQNGARVSGSSSAVSGQPPRPVSARQAAMYTPSTSGRSSRSTLTGTNARLIAAATGSLSNDSRSITWHQWHVA